MSEQVILDTAYDTSAAYMLLGKRDQMDNNSSTGRGRVIVDNVILTNSYVTRAWKL